MPSSQTLKLSKISHTQAWHFVKKVALLLVVLCSDLQSPGLSILVCLISTGKTSSLFHSLSKFKFMSTKAQNPVSGYGCLGRMRVCLCLNSQCLS